MHLQDVRVLAHSRNADTGHELITFNLVYWRGIHAEVMTHRDKSRNASSSRAIPVSTMLKRVWTNMAGPCYWGSNQKGMQAGAELTSWRKWLAQKLWVAGGVGAIGLAWSLCQVGLHKQVANRVLEPFSHINVILSGTEWHNFYRLRVDPDAQPEFQDLAYRMLEAHAASTPQVLQPGQWHMPYGDRLLDPGLTLAQKLMICTARCARVSYLTHDGERDFAKDYKLHNDLAENGHWSPFEHCAMALSRAEGRVDCWKARNQANYRGFLQYRKWMGVQENRGDDGRPFNPAAMLVERTRVLKEGGEA